MKPVTLAEVRPFIARHFSLPLRLSFRLVARWARDLRCYGEAGDDGVPPGMAACRAGRDDQECGVPPRMAACRAGRDDQERGLAGVLVVRQGKQLWEVVSVAVAPEARGRGLAAAMVREFLAEAAAADRTVVAWVRHRNRASCRLFEKTGFVRARVWSFPYACEEILPWGRHYVYRAGMATPSPSMGEGWGGGAPHPDLPPRGGKGLS